MGKAAWWQEKALVKGRKKPPESKVQIILIFDPHDTASLVMIFLIFFINLTEMMMIECGNILPVSR